MGNEKGREEKNMTMFDDEEQNDEQKRKNNVWKRREGCGDGRKEQ